jgi:CarD family transcriptional regulator
MKASAGSAAASRASSTKPGAAAPAAGAGAVAKTAAKPVSKAEVKPQAAPIKAAVVEKPQPAAAKPVKPAAAPALAVKPATEVKVVAPAAPPPAPAAPSGFSAPVVPPLAPPPAAPMMNDRRPPDRGPAPRAHAKQETFVEGDHVVYPTHGVGKVERIATEEIAGHKLELIHITFEENRMTLRVPVTKAPAAGLRKLATRKMFDEALAVLKGRARIKRTMWSRRAQEYEAKINSGDPLAIAEVVRDLHRNAGQPDQSFSERQIYEAAMDRLAAELAALDKTDKATASEKLTNFLKTIVCRRNLSLAKKSGDRVTPIAAFICSVLGVSCCSCCPAAAAAA